MLEKPYDDLVKSNETLIDKFKAYLDASNYDGKKDFKKWLGELVKATDQLESALSNARDKLEAMESALADFVSQYSAAIGKDRTLTETVAKIERVIAAVKMNIDTIQTHVNKYKA